MSSHSYVLPLILIVAGPITAVAAEMDVSQCSAAGKQWQDAFNRGDASAVAALYTSSAIEVTPEGIRVGPAAVKERVEGMLKDKMSNLTIVPTKCEGDGSLRWSSGTWKNDTMHGPVSGFWTAIEVKEGSSWKMQNLTYNMTLPPPAK
jgi:ketosteroid isomerase-like protein